MTYNEEYCKYIDCLEDSFNKDSIFFSIFGIWLSDDLFIDNLDIIIKRESWVSSGRYYQLYFFDDTFDEGDDMFYFTDNKLKFSEGTVLGLLYSDPYEEHNIVTLQELYKYFNPINIKLLLKIFKLRTLNLFI